MDLHGYAQALRRYWWILVLAAVLGGVTGGVIAVRSTPVYAGTVTFFATTPSTSTGNPLQGDEFGQQRVNTYVKLVSSEDLAKRVLADTGVPLSPVQLMKEINGTADLNTVLLTATVSDTSPVRCRALATSLATQFPDLVNEIETQRGQQKAPVQLDVVSGPTVSSNPVGPPKKLDVAIGILVGLLLGAILALALALTDRRIRGADSLREISDAPVLGTVPWERNAKQNALVIDAESTSRRAEAFRQLRANLQFAGLEKPASIFVVCSPRPSEGRTTTAINLALVYAETGAKVLLVETDLRNPRMAKYLGLEASGGLSAVLTGQALVDDELVTYGPTGALTVLPGGSVPVNPSQALGSRRMDDLLQDVRSRFDVIILDTPSTLVAADAVVTAAQSDGAVIVVRRNKTRVADLERTMNALSTAGCRLFGTVVS